MAGNIRKKTNIRPTRQHQKIFIIREVSRDNFVGVVL